MRSETTIAKVRAQESYNAMLQWRKKAEQLENEIAQLRQQLANNRRINHAKP